MNEKGKRNNFRGDIWLEKQIDQRVRDALHEQELAFSKAHIKDTDGQLLEYVRQWANTYGHTPNRGEIIGGKLIERRFGTWEKVIREARLPWPYKMPPLAKREIYKAEFQRQEVLFAKERVAAKANSRVLHQQKAEEAKKAQEERMARDMAWGEEHATDTDEQLLDYLKKCAVELERSPVMKDVEGGHYIAKRIGSWPLALTLAELPLPKGMLPPKQRQLDAYLKKKC